MIRALLSRFGWITSSTSTDDEDDFEPESRDRTPSHACAVPGCSEPQHVHVRFELPDGSMKGGTVCATHNHQIQSYAHGETEPPAWMLDLACSSSDND